MQLCIGQSGLGENGFRFDRCEKKIEVDFCIVRPKEDSNRVSYSYTLARESDPHPLATDVTPDGGQFQFDGTQPLKVQIPVTLPGKYTVKLNVQDSDHHSARGAFGPLSIELYQRTRAVIVGISKYEQRKITELHYAAQDAQSFDKFLRSVIPAPHRDITLMTDADARVESINQALNDAKDDRNFCSEDLFVFYYSGHGFVTQDGDHYLGSYSVKPENLFDTGLSMEQFLSRIDQVGHRGRAKKLVILDSCYSGFYEATPDNTSTTSGPDGKEATVDSISAMSRSAGKEQIVVDGRIAAKGFAVFENPDKIERLRHQLINLPYVEGTIGTAAQANVPAEEGTILTKPGLDRHFFFADEQDRSTLDNSKGHGLYTYFLLGNLERQMSAAHYVDVTDDEEADFKPTGNCKLNFSKAHDRAVQDIQALGDLASVKKHGMLQHPTSVPGKSHLGIIDCESSRSN